jgi:hypothetical protein
MLAEMLKEHVEQNPLNYGKGESALGMLFWCDMEHGSLDSERIVFMEGLRLELFCFRSWGSNSCCVDRDWF